MEGKIDVSGCYKHFLMKIMCHYYCISWDKGINNQGSEQLCQGHKLNLRSGRNGFCWIAVAENCSRLSRFKSIRSTIELLSMGVKFIVDMAPYLSSALSSISSLRSLSMSFHIVGWSCPTRVITLHCNAKTDLFQRLVTYFHPIMCRR